MPINKIGPIKSRQPLPIANAAAVVGPPTLALHASTISSMLNLSNLPKNQGNQQINHRHREHEHKQQRRVLNNQWNRRWNTNHHKKTNKYRMCQALGCRLTCEHHCGTAQSPAVLKDVSSKYLSVTKLNSILVAILLPSPKMPLSHLDTVNATATIAIDAPKDRAMLCNEMGLVCQ